MPSWAAVGSLGSRASRALNPKPGLLELSGFGVGGRRVHRHFHLNYGSFESKGVGGAQGFTLC